ncbi:MAG TPA: hypothetical protein VNH11_12080 [Pirellulales bacterium]|nr:hypothetical protein [Pirellulales bacterium]
MTTLPKPEREKHTAFITTPERVAREKGYKEGLKMGLLASIEALLELRFAAEGLALIPEIRQIRDVDLLGQVLASMKHADTPDAVRQVWAKR